MKARFEELATSQRAGGIESATGGLVRSLEAQGIQVFRSSESCGSENQDAPDIVHFHGTWSPALARHWWHWHKMGVPCMLTVHGMLEPWALAHKRLKKQVAWSVYQKRILNRCQLLHATSEREASNLRALGLRPPIALIPWGIEMPTFERTGDTKQGDVGTAPRATISNPLSPISHPRTALFVGRLYPVKGLPLLIEAWDRLRPPGWRVQLVGPDEAGHRAELESQISRAGLSDVFEFTGALEGRALQQAYASADLLVMPSHTENFGMAVAEGMSHGLPVITTHGAPWKLLEEERCGWWVPISVDGIAAALADATHRSPAELAAMGARGRQVVAERFAWDGIARQFIDCYQWLLGEREVPDCVRKFLI